MAVQSALAIDSEHKRRAENLNFDIDVWYPRLRRFTFPTVFVPLKLAEAQAVVHYYQEFIQGHPDRWSKADSLSLQKLRQRLDTAFREELADWGGAFPRLCGRSLKDADPMRPELARARYQAELDKRPADSSCPEMEALLRVPWMKVTNGLEALALLLSSERAFIDLKDWIQFGEPEQLALRKWNPELTQDWEFRIFVYEGQLTGISQYEHYCHYPHLEPLKGQLEALIVAFWQEMHGSVGAESYVADLGYLPSTGTIRLVELGPFLPCTGTSCFSWKLDTEQLHCGPREFRFTGREQAVPRETVAELVDISWLVRWREAEGRHEATLRNALQLAEPPQSCCCLGSLLPLREDRGEAVLLFVYGTLKRGFHWQRKFLGLQASFLAEAQTAAPWPLVVGRCGVPYVLLDKQGAFAGETCIRGELWRVEAAAMPGLDEYEGVSKGYYARVALDCLGPGPVQAEIYGVARSRQFWSEQELQCLRCVPEYTREMQDDLYRPVEHIGLKQQLYLSHCRRYNALDDHAIPESLS